MLSIRKRKDFLFIMVEKHKVHIVDVLMYWGRRRGKIPNKAPLPLPLGNDHYNSSPRHHRADSFQTNSMEKHGYDSFSRFVPPEDLIQ